MAAVPETLFVEQFLDLSVHIYGTEKRIRVSGLFRLYLTGINKRRAPETD